MKKLRISVLVLLGLLFFHSCQVCQNEEPRAKYVFLFIGDGMGLAQVSATKAYLASMNGGQDSQIGFSDFPVVSFCTTHAATRSITGSAAAGTALATGEKTAIGRISMDTSGTVPLESITEKAKDLGMKVGVISSVSIDHATPAVFYAKQKNRDMYHEIGLDLTRSNFDFFGGGGFREPQREDTDIIDLATENGFIYINDKENFRALKPSNEKILFVNPGLTDGSAMHYAIDQPDDYITLAEITQKAIHYLDNDNGFFIMVEGGKIDWLCHANDAGAMVREVIDFSEAVDEAIAFYQKHPDETLIIVTADHETGGLGLGNNLMHYESDYALLKNQKVSGEAFNKELAEWRKDHAIDEEGFDMVMEVVEENYGIGLEEAAVTIGQERYDDYSANFYSMDENLQNEYGQYNPVTFLSSNVLADHSGLGWTSKSHTCVPVPVYVIGVNSEAFINMIDNTDIPEIIWEGINK